MNNPIPFFRYPDYQANAAKERSNLGLEIYKHLPFLSKERKSNQIDEILKSITSPPIRFPGYYVMQRTKDYESLFHELKGDNIPCFPITLKQEVPAAIGSSPNSAEFGIAFDRNSGIPIIPASSIKGCVRLAYAVVIAKEKGCQEVPEEEIDCIFGNIDSEGIVIFSDCFLTAYNSSCFQKNISNVHSPGKYFPSGEKYPDEKTNPVPVQFLMIAPTDKSLTWKTWMYLRVPYGYDTGFGLVDDDFICRLRKAIDMAFTEIGIGAKTSLGYGRFEVIWKEEPKESPISPAVPETEKQKEEAPVEILDTTCICTVSKARKDSTQLETEDGRRFKFPQAFENLARKDLIKAHIFVDSSDPDKNHMEIIEIISKNA